MRYDGKSIAVIDLMGKDTELLHFAAGQPDQSASLFVSESQKFFEAQLNLVAAPLNS